MRIYEKGLNLITRDGQNYLIAPTTSNDASSKPVRLESVEVDGFSSFIIRYLLLVILQIIC